MQKFPSIEQFRNIVREVKTHHDFKGLDKDESPIYKHTTPYPTLEFTGTVKVHGTNSGIVKYKNKIVFQSRERELDISDDNAGFMNTMLSKKIDFLFEGLEFNDYIAFYGEWAGQGIQSGVAVSQVPKMFIIFGCKIDDKWVNIVRHDNEQKIYHIDQFPTFKINIDFNHPELSQNKLVELTQAVEQECPVGKYFGILGVGEGIVWTCNYNGHNYRFKAKGEKHSVSKVRTIVSIDVEMVESINEFVENTVTENRLKQGVSWLTENGKEVSQKSTGDFIRWVVNDIQKEESDTMEANKLDVKKLNPAISAKARLWFFNYLDRLVIG